MAAGSPPQEIVAGQTFLIPSGPTGKHLFACVFGTRTVPDIGDVVLLVPFCSVPAPGVRFDQTCLIQAGEHPFVTRLTFVDYHHCRIERALDMLQRVFSGYFQRGDDVSAALLQRIAQGVGVSTRLPRYVRRDWL